MTIVNCNPLVKVVTTGNATVCVVVPVNTWMLALATVKVVVVALVAVVAKPSIRLFAA